MDAVTQKEHKDGSVQEIHQSGAAASVSASINIPDRARDTESFPGAHIPHGVKAVEAVTSIWPKRVLIVVMVL